MGTMTDYTRNKIFDAAFRAIGSAQVTFPTTYYLRLMSTAPTAATPGTQLTGTGYAPVALTCSAANFAATNGDGTTTNPSTGTTGQTSNNAEIVVSAAAGGSDWDDISHWELWDASSGGNRWWFGTIVDSGGTPTPRVVLAGDPVKFPISQFIVAMA